MGMTVVVVADWMMVLWWRNNSENIINKIHYYSHDYSSRGRAEPPKR
jgi:hypothetical protein